MSAPGRPKRESFERSEKVIPIGAPCRHKRESFGQSEKSVP
jgi:hypothetical protein